MPLQITPRFATDAELYNPGRDLAYAYPKMVSEVTQRFNSESWPALIGMTDQAGVTYDQLCDAMEAYCLFLNQAHQRPDESMAEVMVRSGWMSQPPAAQVAIMAMLGTVCSGQLFHAIRDLSKPDGPALTNIAALAESGRRCKLLTYRAQWTVKVIAIKERCKRWLKSKLGRWLKRGT